MAEAHARPELEQPGGLRRRDRLRRRFRAARPRARAAGLPDGLGRRDQQQPLRVGGQCLRPDAGSVSSIRPVSGPRSGSPNPPASSAGVSPRGSSSSASGLPRVSATIRSRTRSSSRPGTADGEQRAGVARRRALRRAAPAGRRARRASLGSRTANTIAIRSASSRRATNASACAEAWSSHWASSITQSERALLGRLGQQAQHRERHQEAIRRDRRLQAERHLQRVPLRRRQVRPARRAAARTADAVRRTRAPSRPARPRRARRDTRTRLLGDVLEQRGLADPRLAAQHQHRALPHADALQQPFQRGALVAAVAHHRDRNPTGSSRRSMRPGGGRSGR